MTRLLDFHAERDRDGDSWHRADPDAALIERHGDYAYGVFLPNGDYHTVALAYDPTGHYHGRCDCPGFEYQDGPCAPLCTIRKADFAQLDDDAGRPLNIREHPVEHERFDAAGDRARADGGIRR
jgi:hypothetical protein